MGQTVFSDAGAAIRDGVRLPACPAGSCRCRSPRLFCRRLACTGLHTGSVSRAMGVRPLSGCGRPHPSFGTGSSCGTVRTPAPAKSAGAIDSSPTSYTRRRRKRDDVLYDRWGGRAGRPAVRLRHRRHLRGATVHSASDVALRRPCRGSWSRSRSLGAALGAAAAGYLSDRIGRRRVILGAGLLFIAGAVISAAANDLITLLVGRLFVGLAIGVASMLAPLYLAEISPAEDRGAIVSLNQLCITGGILVSYLVGFALAAAPGGWRWMLALGALPGIILAAGMLVLPESPRWLAGHGRLQDAENVLRRLRGTVDVAGEFGALRTDLAREGRLASAKELLAPRLRRPLVIGVGLAMFQQITGINTVIYFAPTIFQSAGLSSAATVDPGNCRGRRRQCDHDDRVDPSDRPPRPATVAAVEPWRHGADAVCIVLRVLRRRLRPSGVGRGRLRCAYVGFFAIGLGPVFWLLISEIFPLALRGRAMSLATVAIWSFNLIVSATFLDLIGAIGSAGDFPRLRRAEPGGARLRFHHGAGNQGSQPRADRGHAGCGRVILIPGATPGVT